MFSTPWTLANPSRRRDWIRSLKVPSVQLVSSHEAIVIGSGPNGLGAAITLAEAGVSVLLLEKNPIAGGALRSAEVTEPGFVHDLGASVFPLAALSPLIASDATTRFGLAWAQPEICASHPLENGAGVLWPSLDATVSGLGRGGSGYRRLLRPMLEAPEAALEVILGPVLRWPIRPLLAAQLASRLLLAPRLGGLAMPSTEARALWAGVAAHGVLPLRQPVAGGFALALAGAAHLSGWPFASGGSQSISDALVKRFEAAGGTLELNSHVRSYEDLPTHQVALFDTSPESLTELASKQLGPRMSSRLRATKRPSSVFKIDYALDGPIPWKDEFSGRAGTVHVGGDFNEVARSLSQVARGKIADKPFVLVTQPSVADGSRAPDAKHTAWAYCHLPYGCDVDMTKALEARIEQYAPGFKDQIIARKVWRSPSLKDISINLVAGDISGGTYAGLSAIRRPTLSRHPWRVSEKHGIYLCSSSTPPGGGVHGMCGVHAANDALHSNLA